MRLQAPFETSFGRIETRDCILIEVFSEGLSGYGECVADRDPGFSYETIKTAWHILSDYIIPATLHQFLDKPLDFQDRVQHIRGHNMAKAGFELALWDLWGKEEGLSLREILGGDRERVEVGVSIGLQESPQELVSIVEHYHKLGYGRVKIKIKPGRDVNELQAVRRAFPNKQLQVDANSAYSPDSVQALFPLDDLNLLLIEQPLSEDDLWDHHHLQKNFKTPLCLDESIRTPRHAQQALDMEACRIINIKPGRVGGISQAVAIHNICQERGIPVWCGGMLETGVGRAANLALASLANFSLPGDISATDRYYDVDITQQRFTLNHDSTITVPISPGLGVDLDQQAIKEYSLVCQAFS
jgi:O-succinylbenzoate synthase